MGAKGSHGFISLTLEIETPSLVSACNGSLSSLDGNVIFAFNGLAVEDEEGDGFVGFPAVKIMFDVRLNTGQAAEGREKRFVIRNVVEEQLQIVGGINRNSTVLKLRDFGRPTRLLVS